MLSTTEGTLTDEDIDTLLLRGEERTQAINSKLSTEVQHSLATFSVQMEDCVELNMFTFEGEDFKKTGEGARRKSGVDALEFQIALPQRERKRNFEGFDLVRHVSDYVVFVRVSSLVLRQVTTMV